MKAIDTNLLVRLVARDDPTQFGEAREVIAAGDVLVLPTVILETEWVLRSRYQMPRRAIVDGLFTVLAQPGVAIVSPDAIGSALDAYARAGDFADLLQSALALELGTEAMITFDRSFAAVQGLAVHVPGQSGGEDR